MNEALTLIGGILILGFSVVLLKNFGWSGAPVLGCLGGVLVLGGAFDSAGGIFTLLSEYAGKSGAGEVFSAAVKLLGVGYLFGISSDILSELGERFIAKCTEIAGRVELMLILLPFAEEILKLGGALMEGV